MTKSIRWHVGITTTPERKEDLLPRTLRSLEAAGFPEPWMFVDLGGAVQLINTYLDHTPYTQENTTFRYPRIRAFGNFWLGCVELWVRACAAWQCPKCGKAKVEQGRCRNGDCLHEVEDRFLMTQDDIVWCRNVRQYLDSKPWPRSPRNEPTYLNLYTFSTNEDIIRGKRPGTWHEASYVFGPSDERRLQTGRGAVALCFTAEGMQTLLSAPTMAAKPRCPVRGHLAVDGAVVTAMNAAGWREMVHCPSMIRHTGTEVSVIKSQERGQQFPFPYPADLSFPGEEFDSIMWVSGQR